MTTMTTMTAAQIRAHTDAMPPDPQVPERPRPPRQYPATYKVRVLAEYEQLDKAGKGALLRREGLYTSLISEWRKQRDKGALAALEQRRGRPPADLLQRELARLQAENGRLQTELGKARLERGNQSGRLWLGQRGPLSISGVTQAVLVVGQQAGINGLRPHRLRHTDATRLRQGGADPAQVQALLGHASVETARRYFRAGADEQAVVVERSSSSFSLRTTGRTIPTAGGQSAVGGSHDGLRPDATWQP
jgi:transposase-like protein